MTKKISKAEKQRRARQSALAKSANARQNNLKTYKLMTGVQHKKGTDATVIRPKCQFPGMSDDANQLIDDTAKADPRVMVHVNNLYVKIIPMAPCVVNARFDDVKVSTIAAGGSEVMLNIPLNKAYLFGDFEAMHVTMSATADGLVEIGARCKLRVVGFN